jgi:hypothetical protein
MAEPHNLTHNVVTSVVLREVAAGTTSTASSAVDTLGYAGVRFVAGFGTLTASQVTNLKAQHSDDNSTWADIAGTATANLADADGGKLLIVDVFKPTKRYVRASVQRGTANAVINGVIAERYRAAFGGTTADSSVSAQEVHNSPASGTA